MITDTALMEGLQDLGHAATIRPVGAAGDSPSLDQLPFTAYDIEPPVDEEKLVEVLEKHFGVPAVRAGVFYRFGMTSVRTEETWVGSKVVRYVAIGDGDLILATDRDRLARPALA